MAPSVPVLCVSAMFFHPITRFSLFASILPTSAIHCDGDDLHQMPMMTGES
jgi:hypothetical protein